MGGSGPQYVAGKQIDANPNEPLKFKLRQRQILRGMDIAIEGMCVGDKISVIIPPHLGFDDPAMSFRSGGGYQNIPAPVGASLKYEIELVALEGGASTSAIPVGMIMAIGFLAMIIAILVYLAMRKDEGGKASKDS